MSFRGTFDHALDAKHRLTIPARFRAPLAGGVVLAPSSEIESGAVRGIAIWTPDEYDAFTSAVLGGMNAGSPLARELKRFYFNTSFDTELDAANRVMIPTQLMEYAGLTKEVKVTGSGECLEVFDRGAYDRSLADVLARIPDLTARLGDPA